MAQLIDPNALAPDPVKAYRRPRSQAMAATI